MIKLAIVIPYYKIDFFEETLKSVALQSNKNFILYIGNDSSPETPIPIISKYLKKENYKYFYYKDNLGGKNLSLQWERILDNIQEEWFQILGDDDVISENFVEEFYKALPEMYKSDISVMKFIHEWIDEYSKHIETFDYKSDIINSVDFIMKKYANVVKSSLSENIFQTKMYRKYKFEKLPLAWGSDDIALLTFSNFGKIFYNSNSIVQVRISSSSISGSEKMDKKKNDAYNIFREKIILKYSKKFPAQFISEILNDYLNYCHLNRQKASFKVLFIFFKKFEVMLLLKTMKRIYYINKMSLH